VRPTSGSYTEHLKQNAEPALEPADAISSFGHYPQIRVKLKRLEQKLEIWKHGEQIGF